MEKGPNFPNVSEISGIQTEKRPKELALGLPRDSSQGAVTTTKGSCIGSWNGRVLLHLDPQLKLIVKQLYETLKVTHNNALVGTGECQETFLTMKKITTDCSCSVFARFEKVI